MKLMLSLCRRSLNEIIHSAILDGELVSNHRTVVLYKIIRSTAIARDLLTNGDGREVKGFKSEWLAVKHALLDVGG